MINGVALFDSDSDSDSKKFSFFDSDSDSDSEKFHFYNSDSDSVGVGVGVGVGIGFRTPKLITNRVTSTLQMDFVMYKKNKERQGKNYEQKLSFFTCHSANRETLLPQHSA